jgi:hypothetical protein
MDDRSTVKVFMVEEIMVEKFMVEKFMVENSGFEMSCNHPKVCCLCQC